MASFNPPQLAVLLMADYNNGNRLLVVANSDHSGLPGTTVPSRRPHIFNWTSLLSPAILLDRVMRVHPNLCFAYQETSDMQGTCMRSTAFLSPKTA